MGGIFSRPSTKTELAYQEYEIFTLSPNSERVLLRPPTKRAGDPDLEQGPKRARLTDPEVSTEISPDIKALVDYYELNSSQVDNLRLRANRTGFVPTIEEVEWVVEQAHLRDGDKINVVMFAYMEYYPWVLRSHEDDHRVYMGQIKEDDEAREVWNGFTPKSQLYHDSPRPGKVKSALKLYPVRRRHIQWFHSFENLFQLGAMDPESDDDIFNAKKTQIEQTAYIRAAMKVLARFPGLVFDFENDHSNAQRQVYQGWSAWPFKCREEASALNPLAKLFQTLCLKNGTKFKLQGKGSKMARSAFNKEVIEISDDDEDDYEGYDHDDFDHNDFDYDYHNYEDYDEADYHHDDYDDDDYRDDDEDNDDEDDEDDEGSDEYR